MAVIRKTKANISFKYSNRLKTLYKKGKIKVPTGFYGDVLTKDNTTLEHIVPHSLGGKTVEDNLVLSSSRTNNLRGNKELRLFFNKEAFEKYCSYFKDVVVKDFNGNEYVRKIRKTVYTLLNKENGRSI